MFRLWQFVTIWAGVVLGTVSLHPSSQSIQAITQDPQPVPTVYAGFQNDTGEDIRVFIGSANNGFSNPAYFLPKGGTKTILFYDDHRERALVAFNMKGDKVVSQFAFEPAFLLFTIQKNHVTKEGAKSDKVQNGEKLSSAVH